MRKKDTKNDASIKHKIVIPISRQQSWNLSPDESSPIQGSENKKQILVEKLKAYIEKNSIVNGQAFINMLNNVTSLEELIFVVDSIKHEGLSTCFENTWYVFERSPSPSPISPQKNAFLFKQKLESSSSSLCSVSEEDDVASLGCSDLGDQ